MSRNRILRRSRMLARSPVLSRKRSLPEGGQTRLANQVHWPYHHRVQERPHDLPDFRHPPVIEVVIGAQFGNLADVLSAAQIGSFWEQVRDRYPKTEDALPLARQYDAPAQHPAAAAPRFLALPPIRRSYLISECQNWLVQVQADRLLHNWRAVREDDEYPRFEECYERFVQAWGSFSEFCSERELVPEVDQLEVTYINHIPAGKAWKSLEDLSLLFPDLGWRTGNRYLRRPESLAFAASFEMDGAPGRLHLSIKHGLRRGPTEQQILVCELTTRGRPEAKMTMEEWIHKGRAMIVRAFADLTTDDVQQSQWGKQA